MTDLVQKLVGALERLSGQCERMRMPGQRMSDAERNAIAALSEAKAGGWVAVPVEPTPEMLKAGETAYWQKVRDVQSPTPTEFYDECGGPIGYAWIAMLAARPLPAPPAQRGEG